jgi:CBS domain-containing protein
MATLKDIMTKDPITVRPDDSAQKAAGLMKDNHIGPIPVLDQERKLIGMVTDRDLAIKVVAEGRPADTKVSDVMTRDLFTCGPDDNVKEALRTMETHQVRRVPIVDDQGHLLGIVAQADLATKTGKPEKVAQAVESISQASEAESR